MTSEEYEATLDPFRRLVYRAGNGAATADETYQLRLYIQNPMTAKQDRIDAQTALRRGGYTDTDQAAYNRAQDEYYSTAKGTATMETLQLEQIIEIDNYRTEYGDLDSLVNNMRANGFNPEYAVTVMPLDAYTVKSRLPMFGLVKGHRRTRSARLAGLAAIPAHIQTALSPVARKLDQLAENENRSNPNAIDQANGFQQALDLGATLADLMLHTGHKEAYISKRLALLTLTAEAQRMVASKYLSIDYAHELTRLKPEYQGAALSAYTRASRCDLATFKDIVADLYTKQIEAENKQQPLFGGELLVYIETAIQTIEANRAKTRAELEAELEAEKKLRLADRQYAIARYTAMKTENERLKALLQGKAA